MSINELKIDLLDYIKQKRCYCGLCAELKHQILHRGLIAIDEYEGMICGGVEDFQIRYAKIKGA